MVRALQADASPASLALPHSRQQATPDAPLLVVNGVLPAGEHDRARVAHADSNTHIPRDRAVEGEVKEQVPVDLGARL